MSYEKMMSDYSGLMIGKPSFSATFDRLLSEQANFRLESIELRKFFTCSVPASLTKNFMSALVSQYIIVGLL